MTPALSIRDIAAGYEDLEVLKGVSLDVGKGEIFGLIGLNGVGKTTLIKTILALVRPTDGSIEIFGQSHRSPDSRQNIAYLPEKFQPPAMLSGDEFVRFTLSFYGLAHDPQLAQEKALDIELESEALDRRAAGYSKGMGQKVGLLATLLTDLPLLILDEPMSGLDPKARIGLKRQLMEYRARGHSVFLSSHILSDLDEICDRIGILHEGRLLYVGTPSDLRTRQNQPSLELAFLAAIDAETQNE